MSPSFCAHCRDVQQQFFRRLLALPSVISRPSLREVPILGWGPAARYLGMFFLRNNFNLRIDTALSGAVGYSQPIS
jgi:hypothetical protein